MKKILMIGDAGCRTGFARVVKGVADHLHASGKWEVVVRGINFNENHNIDYSYDVQAVTFGGTDPTGAATVPYHIDDLKPDVLWCLQDPWHLQGYAVEKPRDLPSVAYVPVDTPCIKWEHGIAMGAWSQLASYTRFGARELSASVQEGFDVLREHTAENLPAEGKTRWLSMNVANRRKLEVRLDRIARMQNIDAWNIIPHGRQDDLFMPREKAACRRDFGIPEDGFVVGMVGGNQVRKRLDTALRVFAQFAQDQENALFVLHCWGEDQGGWDVASLARFYGIADRVSCIHWQWPELSDDQLCSLYNTFDVMLNTSSGEGWGLPAMESAACGIPQIVPDWAATKELWSGNAQMIPVLDYLHFEKYLNTAHAVLNVKAAVQLLRDVAGNPELHEQLSAAAQKRVKDLPTWAEVGAGFDTILEKALSEGSPSPTSMNDVLAARNETVRSSILTTP